MATSLISRDLRRGFVAQIRDEYATLRERHRQRQSNFEWLSLEDARAFGWVTPATAAAPWYEGWEYVDFGSVVWAAVPAQGVSWLAMVVVVAFSSCLDVAAIEMEMGRPLDYDHELQTVRGIGGGDENRKEKRL